MKGQYFSKVYVWEDHVYFSQHLVLRTRSCKIDVIPYGESWI